MTTHAVGSSGLDVASIVSQLMAVERRPLIALARKEASFQAKISAYGSIKGALGSFQSAVSGLSNAAKFQALKATPSDSTLFTASATGTAVPGTYALEVSKLAQSQKLAAAGKPSSTDVIGNGTLTFDFGTITSNNTFNSTTGLYGTSLAGAATINGSITITGVSTTNLVLGAGITGVGIPAGATISTIPDGTTFTLSIAATATATATLTAHASFTSNGAGTKIVTIVAGNNSLQGIRDAINAAKIGVTATIINDGGASPYRLALTSDSIGKINSMKISVVESDGAGLAALLAHDPAGLPAAQRLAETATAQNAEFKVDGVAVSKTSNTVSDVIQGVTLNLQKVTTTAASLAVARDTATVKSSIDGFVKAYNDLSKMLRDASAYNPATKQGAILQGDSTVRTLQSQMRAVLNTPVGNTGGSLTTLSQIGVSFQKDGSLALDTSKLNTTIDNNFNDIASLFAAVGKASDSLVSYSSATSSTKPGSYAVYITTLATQGKLIGSAPAASLTIAPGNDVLDVTLNGVSASVTLTAGNNYTAATLAAEVQSRINGASALSGAGISVAVTQSGGVFTLTSNSYGSASTVAVTGNGAANLLGSSPVPTPTAGLDVVGTIDGAAATGAGQSLTTSTGNATGLKIQISGGAQGTTRGTVNYSQGYAYTLNALSTSLLASGGPLAGRTDGISSSIKDIDKQRDALGLRLEGIEKRYRKQFSSLDAMLSSMNQTSNYLTQQLDSIRNLNRY